MSKQAKPTNPPTYPFQHMAKNAMGQTGVRQAEGLSLRDRVMIAVLPQVMANEDQAMTRDHDEGANANDKHHHHYYVRRAYQIANEALRQRQAMMDDE